ncbi:hypothetical protein A4G19_04275 [Pasteurellaceae bacterium Macca]|nr:hypothetical protein [Pasteurellaceae bacterium Macca]
METLFSVKDVQAVGGFGRSFIYANIKKGLLAKPIRIGRLSRWKKSDVEAWLNILIQQGQSDTLRTPKANQAKQGGKDD